VARGGVTLRENVITTEILRYPSTDVVAVGEHLPFRDATFDAVISLHVLEHVKNPFICASELARVPKPGGTLYAVTPYVVGVHGFPFHFFNPTPSGLRAIFEGKLFDADVSVPRPSHAVIAAKGFARRIRRQLLARVQREVS
jgi:SAM-dependent methyltransferase